MGVVVAVAVGVAVGVGVLAISRGAELPAAAPGEKSSGSSKELRLLATVAFVSGLTSLAAEVAWTRVLILIVGSTN